MEINIMVRGSRRKTKGKGDEQIFRVVWFHAIIFTFYTLSNIVEKL